MNKTVRFKTQPRTPEQWIDEGTPEQPPKPPSGPMKRFTIDVPADLHKRIKSECAGQGLKMADVLREMLETRFGVKS
jgi:hypothetical protein